MLSTAQNQVPNFPFQNAHPEMWLPLGNPAQKKARLFRVSQPLQLVPSVSLKIEMIQNQFSREFKWETGRLVLELLALKTASKVELLQALYPRYEAVSFQQKLSLETSLSKLIQRARARFSKYGISIAFDKETETWELVSI